MNELFTDLHACINCLGITHEGKFLKDVDTNVSLRDILRYLRRESNQCEIRIELGKFNVVGNRLIPLIKSNYNDSILFDLIIRLLMNLTQPAFICFKQELPKDVFMANIYTKIDMILQNFKSRFSDKEFFKVLSSHIDGIFNKMSEDRSEDDHLMVERILILVRNILHIKTTDLEEGKIPDGMRSHQDNLVMSMMESGWKELLIFLCNTEDETRFAFHTLEIISLIFREQSCDFMKTSKSNHKPDPLLNQQMMRAQELEAKERASINPRASRYGGTFELRDVKSTSGRPMIYHHDIVSSKIDLSRDRKMQRKAKNRLPNTEEIRYHRSEERVLKTLQEFCSLFLEFGFNHVMSAARSKLIRNQMQTDDETYFLWAMKFFISVCRSNDFCPEFVSEMVSVEVFHWVYSQAIMYLEVTVSEKDKAKSFFRKLHFVVSAYKELLKFLLMMDKHKDEKYRKLSAHIKCQVFYQEEYLDMYPMLLVKFDPIRQSRAQLRELIEGSYLMIRILYNHKSFDMNVVRKLKKKRTKRKSKVPKTDAGPPSMPGDSQDELLPIWNDIVDLISSAVKGEVDMPDNSSLPCVFDPMLPEEREEIEPGSEPVDSQLKKTLGIVQARLRQRKPLEAVALFRLAQVLWPEEDRISVAESENPVEEEIAILKSVMLAPAFYRQEDVFGVVEVEEEQLGADNDVDSELEEEREYLAEEVAFDPKKYLLKFCHPKIVSAYGVLFNDFPTNPKETNDSLLHIMYHIAEKCKMPYILYQLKLFNGFAKFLRSPLSTEFKEMRKFVLVLMKRFTEHVATNRKLLIEIMFMKTPKEAFEAVHGYEEDEEDKSKKWTEELDEELARLFEEAKTEEILPGLDAVNVVENRLSDPTKTRRQIIGRLINLGLIKSVKELKKKKRTNEPWTDEEQGRLVILFEESRNQSKPIRDIMNGLKATAIDPNNVRSQRMVVKKILELGLVNNVNQLGIKPNLKKQNKRHNSDSDESGDSGDNEDDRQEMDEETRFMHDVFDKAMLSIDGDGGLSVRRAPPPIKTQRIVDWTAFKMTYARLKDDDKKWFVEMLGENIGLRANGIVATLAIIPLQETESEILESDLMKKLLTLCYFIYPDSSQGYQFWRIPEDMTAKELEYFRNCVTSLTENELKALTMTDLSVQESSRAPKTSSAKRPIKKDFTKLVKNKEKIQEFSDSSTSDTNKENIFKLRTKKKSLKSTLFDDSESSSSDSDSDVFEKTADKHNNTKDNSSALESDLLDEDFSKKHRNKRTILDSDEENETISVPIKRKRIFDDEEDD